MSWLKGLFQPTASSSDTETTSQHVKDELRKDIASFDDIDKKHRQQIYEVLLHAPGNLYEVCIALMKVEGMTQGRAAEIARSLSKKTNAIREREHDVSLGITHARWMYANSPCMRNPSNPVAADFQQDSAHQLANGKQYEIKKGLLIDGKWTWPGVENGCKCFARVVLPEFE